MTPTEPDPPQPREGVFDEQLSFSTPYAAPPEPIATLVTREGREVPFRTQAVADGIYEAALSIGDDDRDRAQSLAAGVAMYLAKQTRDKPPTESQLDDAVEMVLIEMGQPKTALAYARRREKRERLQRIRRGDLQVLLTELREAEKERDAGQTPGPLSLFVRTGDERLASWDRERIAGALVRETQVPRERAEMVALEVEEQLAKAQVSTLTTSLIRELVDAKLIEHGLESCRRKHMRLGVPLYDAEQIICVPNQGEAEALHSPDATDRILAERVKKEFALTHVFSQAIGDAHHAGDIQLHALGHADRLLSMRPSLGYLARFGLDGGRGALARPAAYPGVLLRQAGRSDAIWRSHFSRELIWRDANIHIAPFLFESDDAVEAQVARALLRELAGDQAPGRRLSCVSGLQLAASPQASGGIYGPGGRTVPAQNESLREGAARFALHVLEAYEEADDAAGAPPWLRVRLGEADFSRRQEFVRRAAEAALSRRRMDFEFDRADDESAPEAPSWQPARVDLHDVSLNLPRAALRGGTEEGLVGELERMFGLAAQAHAEKRRFLENLMECRGLGPMAVLAAQRDGQPLVDLAHGRYLVSLVGLNECVQSVAGAQLHEDRSAADLAERLLTHLGRLCAERGAADDLRLALSASPDEAVAHRFAALDLQERPDETRGVMKTDGVTGDIQYTPGVAVSDNAGLTPLGRALLEGRFHRRLNGPAVTQLRIPASGISAESLAAFLEAACRRTEARALQFTW